MALRWEGFNENRWGETLLGINKVGTPIPFINEDANECNGIIDATTLGAALAGKAAPAIIKIIKTLLRENRMKFY